ncbi:competence protein ComK [Viridibacillus arvi]|uniref:competence protein ComK n=1 Tax=Viridibacillus arvi TaxID=263475 RepID=UPI0034CE47C4
MLKQFQIGPLDGLSSCAQRFVFPGTTYRIWNYRSGRMTIVNVYYTKFNVYLTLKSLIIYNIWKLYNIMLISVGYFRMMDENARCLMMFDKDLDLITTNSFVLSPLFEGEMKSKVMTRDGYLYSTLTPIQLLEKICIRYGSTFQGRIDAVKELLGYSKKLPLYIGEGIYAYPTRSPYHPECVWVFYHSYRYEAYSKGQTILYFDHGEIVILDISLHTVKEQQQRLASIILSLRFNKQQTLIRRK